MKSTVLTLFVSFLFLGILPQEDTNDISSKNPVVLELFTSQGCSSCPPADKLLKEVRSDDVIALSYHVDYWDYIGWPDPYSSEKYTEKQRNYSYKFNSSTLYTPQVVINGKEHFVGSDSRKMKTKIEKYSKIKSQLYVDIVETKLYDNFASFAYEIDGNIEDNYLRIVLVIDERVTAVDRGENKFRTLTNSNIVVAEQRFKLDNIEGKGSIQIPEIVNEDDALALVLIVEKDNLDIVGADEKPL